MTFETEIKTLEGRKARINSFLFNLSAENYRAAEEDIKHLVNHTLKQRYDKALEEVKKSLSK